MEIEEDILGNRINTSTEISLNQQVIVNMHNGNNMMVGLADNAVNMVNGNIMTTDIVDNAVSTLNGNIMTTGIVGSAVNTVNGNNMTVDNVPIILNERKTTVEVDVVANHHVVVTLT